MHSLQFHFPKKKAPRNSKKIQFIFGKSPEIVFLLRSEGAYQHQCEEKETLRQSSGTYSVTLNLQTPTYRSVPSPSEENHFYLYIYKHIFNIEKKRDENIFLMEFNQITTSCLYKCHRVKDVKIIILK